MQQDLLFLQEDCFPIRVTKPFSKPTSHRLKTKQNPCVFEYYTLGPFYPRSYSKYPLEISILSRQRYFCVPNTREAKAAIETEPEPVSKNWQVKPNDRVLAQHLQGHGFMSNTTKRKNTHSEFLTLGRTSHNFIIELILFSYFILLNFHQLHNLRSKWPCRARPVLKAENRLHCHCLHPSCESLGFCKN